MESRRLRSRSQNAAFVIESIRAIGLSPSPDSRLMRMCRLLTREESIVPENPDFEIAVEAERDLQELAFVFEQAERFGADPKFHQLIRIALKDSALPQNDRAQSKGRDAQFELFVAAICQRAGMLPVVREEPDVTCNIRGIKFGLAAKRLKDVARLQERIRDAAHQIEQIRLPGIIVLNTDVALNRDNKRITVPIPHNQFGILYKQAMTHFIDRVRNNIQQWVRGKEVRAVIFHDQQVRVEPNGQWSLNGMTMSVNTARHNQRRNREYDSFWKYYSKGLPNVERLTNPDF